MAANRDERTFDAPERFDITRTLNPHLGFGYGPHVCAGMSFGKIMLRVALATFADRLPTISLAVPERDLFVKNHNLHSLSLGAAPVTW